MAVTYKGLTVKFGGDTTELSAALKSLSAESRKTQSDLKDINKALKLDPGNTELLEQKVRSLNKAYDETKSRLSAYKDALADLEERKRTNGKLTADEQRQYDSLVRDIVKAEKSLESYGDQIKEVTREHEASQTAAYKFGQKLQDNSEKIEKVGSGMTKAGAAITGAATAGVAGLVTLSESQEENIVAAGKLETAFQAAGSTVEQGNEVYANFYRILGDTDTATEASQNLVRLTTNQQELSAWADIAAGAYATFGDALPLENLAETAQETAHTGTVTGSFADALNWSTAATETFSQSLSGHEAAQKAFNDAIADGATKEDAYNAALEAVTDPTERASMVTETLTALYGDAGKQYQDTNKDLLAVRDAQNDSAQAMTEAAKAAQPFNQAYQELKADVLEALVPLLQQLSEWYKNLSPEQQELARNVVLATVAFGGITTAVGGFMQNISGIGAGLKTFSGLFSSGDGAGGLAGAMGKVKGAATGLWTVISANPIMAVVAVIGAIVAALAAWFTQTDEGRAAWQSFCDWFKAIWQGVSDFFGPIIDGIKNAFQGVTDFLGAVFGPDNEARAQAFSNAWEGAKGLVGDAVEGVKGFFSDCGEKIGSWVSDCGEKFNQWVEDNKAANEAIKADMSAKWDSIRDKVAGKVDEIGEKLGFPGLGDKVRGVFDNVKAFMEDPLGSAASFIRGKLDELSNWFSSLRLELPHIKLPHFSIRGEFSLNPPSIPTIGIDWYAKGGIISSPRVIGVGEAGPEAVLPIDRLSNLMARAMDLHANQAPTEVSIEVNVAAQMNSNLDARRLGQEIGAGIQSTLKQRGVVGA